LKKNIKSLFILLKKAQAVVQKISRQNVTSTVLIFFSVFLMDVMGGNISQLKRNYTEKGKRRNTCTPEKS